MQGTLSLRNSKSASVQVTIGFAITTTSVPNGIVGTPYSQTIGVVGGTSPYAFSLAPNSGPLPPPLTINPTTGVISGTPTTAGTYPFTVQVKDSSSPQLVMTQALSITIYTELSFPAPAVPNGVVGTPYTISLGVSGGTASYNWSISAGALPSCLSLASATTTSGTNSISGTPVTGCVGAFSFTVKVTDSSVPAQVQTQALSGTIYAGLTFLTTSLPNDVVGTPYSQAVTVAGGTGPYTWSVSAGALPTCLSLASLTTTSGTNTLAGTPVNGCAGLASFTLKVVDSSSPQQSKTQAFSFNIYTALAFPVVTLPGGAVGTAYSGTLSVSGGTEPYIWSISSGALPACLSIASASTTTGANSIIGSPVTACAGNFSFTVKVTDSSSPAQVSIQPMSVTILGITTTTLPAASLGVAYNQTLAAVGGSGSYTWSVSAGTFPASTCLALAASTGAITGTPVSGCSNTYTFTVQVKDTSTPQLVTTQALSLTINTVGVSISSPTNLTQSVTANGTLGITASVTGTTDTAVTWTVNSIANGNTTFGTITGTGLSVIYNAPATIPSPATFNVTVTSTADNTKSASVSITITAPVITVTITSPTSLTQNVAVNGTLAITAAVANTSNSAVTWTVNGVTNGNSTYGTIVGTGLSVTYDAPAAVPSPATFNVTATSAADTSKSASVSVTITSATAACSDSGSESLLKGQYAFVLSGFSDSGFLAAVGSFTADGAGKITAGILDSNGALVQTGASIDPTRSSYSVGANHLGCATIVTSAGTFTTRLSVGGITSGVATQGRVVEWDTTSGSNYLSAVGQIRQQTVPTNVPSGNFVYENTGVYGTNQYRTGVLGMVTIAPGTSGGTITYGEYDVNVEGVINDGNGLSTPYTGVTGSYTAPDPTTGRFTTTATLNSNTNHQVGYLVSSTQFLEMGTDALSSTTAVLVGGAQFQSGSASFTTGSNLVYYATGTESAELGIINVTGSTSYTATYYEDVFGSAETPQTPACTYATDTYGRVVTSGATCTMYLTTYKTMYPPVFYLSGPNTGFMLGTGAGVYAGQVDPQVVPSGGFSASSISGVFYDGDTEVVSEEVAADDMIDVEALTFDGSGGVDIIGDYTGAAGSVVTQNADVTNNTTLGTVNSNGTFTTNTSYPGINAIMISTTKIVNIDNSTNAYPIIQVIKQ